MRKNESEGGGPPSIERKAIKLGLATHLLEIYQSGGVEAVQKYLIDGPLRTGHKGRPVGDPLPCSREEALAVIETSRGIVEDMGLS